MVWSGFAGAALSTRWTSRFASSVTERSFPDRASSYFLSGRDTERPAVASAEAQAGRASVLLVDGEALLVAVLDERVAPRGEALVQRGLAQVGLADRVAE